MRTRVRATWRSRSMFDKCVRVRGIDGMKQEQMSITKAGLCLVL